MSADGFGVSHPARRLYTCSNWVVLAGRGRVGPLTAAVDGLLADNPRDVPLAELVADIAALHTQEQRLTGYKTTSQRFGRGRLLTRLVSGASVGPLCWHGHRRGWLPRRCTPRGSARSQNRNWPGSQPTAHQGSDAVQGLLHGTGPGSLLISQIREHLAERV